MPLTGRFGLDPAMHCQAAGGACITSTQVALVNSASRAGLMRRALWVEPAAGITSSKVRSEMSQ